VLLETGNALSKSKYRAAAIALLASIEDDATIDVVELSNTLYASGLELFRQRPDKDWSLTDCISFAVMHDEGVSEALTPDHHFEQAGFRALLLA
jgi:predicted nucleic acid-binding protein